MGNESTSPSDRELILVGIAASAGGLEAVSVLVQNLPKESNSAYIINQHMSPSHKSLMSTLIARETALPVLDVEDGTQPVADTIYVVPPNTDIEYRDRKLRLLEPEGHPASPKPSADRLFTSLADECGEHSVAIVLSGTGGDGSYGVQAVRAADGITIAQEPSSAKYDGMPSTAIQTGCIDLTLTPAQIGQHLQRILSVPRDFGELQHLNDTPTKLSDLFQILMARTGVDFREYKEATINRRISRRMIALGMDSYQDYVDHCRNSTEETDALYRDLLISVTRFFRDQSHFDQLSKVICSLVETAGKDQIRIWVAGCATGEEAFSIAILLVEAFGGLEAFRKRNVQVFASDIDERALEVGRKGTYPITALKDIPTQYHEKYFTIQDSNIRVHPDIRQAVLFSRHNIAQDPPFINIDLLSLRNLLIYFNQALQEKVLSRVHYALNPGALLFLGTSESIGQMHGSFEAQSGCDKVFAKRLLKPNRPLAFGDTWTPSPTTGTKLPAKSDEGADKSEVHLFEALARTIAPNGFIATKRNEIVRVFGDISKIVEISEHSSLRMNTHILRKGLRDEASSLISVALKTGGIRAGRWHPVSGDDKAQIRLRAHPIPSTSGGEGHVLFALEDRQVDVEAPRLLEMSEADRARYVLQIEAEMATTRESLEQTVEELQTTNEELQSVNEEMQSTNEELQATNEELETSNEELQSTNEELITVNEELKVNSAELQKLSHELDAVLQNTPNPVLILDQALLIRRLSERARTFFGLGEAVINGTHISKCRPPDGFPALSTLCSDSLRVREFKSVDVESAGKGYAVNVSPYFDSHELIMGLQVVVVESDA